MIGIAAARIFLPLCLIISILALGCSSDSTGPDNSPPRITGIEIELDGAALDPSQVNTVASGQMISLTAKAEDPDRDPLTCSWEAEVGVVDRDDAFTVQWQVPDSSGTFTLTATVTDGKATASGSASFKVIVTAILSAGSVTPGSGHTEDAYTYEVTFRDPFGALPAHAEVLIDGSAAAMNHVSGTQDDGALYGYQTTLDAGSHQYVFRFTDGRDSTLTYPSEGYALGPVVSDDPDVSISPNTVIVDEIRELSFDHIAGTTLVFDYAGGPPHIPIGTVVVGSEGGGYLRKITRATAEGGKIELETTDASLVDALIEGSMQTDIDLSLPGEGALLDPADWPYISPCATIENGGVRLDSCIIYSGTFGDAWVTASIPEGYVKFEPDFDFGFEVDDSSIVEVHGIITGTVYLDLELEIDASTVFSDGEEYTVYEFKKHAWQVVGGLPVVEEITVSFILGFEAEAQVGGISTIGFSDTCTVSFGARYQNEFWLPVWNPECSDGHGHEPTWEATAELDAKVYFKMAVSTEIYAVAGPYLEVIPYARFDATVTTNPPCWEWGLYGGIESNLGFLVHILDFELADFSVPLDWPELKLAGDEGCIGEGWTVFDTSNSIIPHNHVYAIALDIDGKKWIATGNEAVCLLGNGFEGCTGIGCTASEITVDQLGGKWFSTDAGVLTYIQGQWTTYNMSNSDLPDDFVLDVAIDWWSRKWFATQSKGLARLDGEGWTVFDPDNSDIPDWTVTAIGVDNNNHIWVGTPLSGAAKFDGDTWAVYDTTGGRLGTNGIGDIDVDPQGNVWFGLKAEARHSSSAGSGRGAPLSAQLYGGVTKFDGSKWTTYTPANMDGMLPDVTTILALGENDVWIGGFAGASHFDGEIWEWFSPTNSGLPDYSVNAIAADGAGFVWFGTYEGLARYRE